MDAHATQKLIWPVRHVAAAVRTLRSALGALRSVGYGPPATAVAYAIGAEVGFHLRFPPATTSILWPPHSRAHRGSS